MSLAQTRDWGLAVPCYLAGLGSAIVVVPLVLRRLSQSGGQTMRAPQVIQNATASSDLVVFESYDDQNYGYLRIVVTQSQLRIEYHPATRRPLDQVAGRFRDRRPRDPDPRALHRQGHRPPARRAEKVSEAKHAERASHKARKPARGR